jgi:hypothetical protein
MVSFAMPQTEIVSRPLSPSMSEDLLKMVLLISSAPVDYNEIIYYLPLVSNDDLNAMETSIEKAEILEGVTKDFLEKISSASLKIISGLSGQLLPTYHSDQTILLLTTTQGFVYIVYGWLDGQFLKM